MRLWVLTRDDSSFLRHSSALLCPMGLDVWVPGEMTFTIVDTLMLHQYPFYISIAYMSWIFSHKYYKQPQDRP